MDEVIADKVTHSVPVLKYQGRKTRRNGSEKRRRSILEAALRIVVRDGVRGVRHRAVAKEANVPLSATTYYFKDISDLITDAFTLFVETGASVFRTYWSGSHQAWESVFKKLEEGGDLREQLVKIMTEMAIEYVQKQLEFHKDYLLAEQAFKIECLRNVNLRTIARSHRQYLLEDLTAFFRKTGSGCPEADARLLLTIISSMEYEGLFYSVASPQNTEIEQQTSGQIKDMLYRQIDLMISNKNIIV